MQNKPMRKPNVLERLFFGCTVREIPKLIPGVLIIVALVALVIFLTDLINSALGLKGLISYILVVIVMGILLRNLITIPAIFMPGINFSVKKLLRLKAKNSYLSILRKRKRMLKSS